MRTEGHVGERDVSGDLTNSKSQVSLDIGRVAQLDFEGGLDPDI